MTFNIYDFEYNDKTYWFFNLQVVPFGCVNNGEVVIDDCEIDFKHAESIDDNDVVTVITKGSPEYKQLIDIIVKSNKEQLEQEIIDNYTYL